MLNPFLHFDFVISHRSIYFSITVPFPFASLFTGEGGKKHCFFLTLQSAKFPGELWDIDRSFWITSEGVKV